MKRIISLLLISLPLAAVLFGASAAAAQTTGGSCLMLPANLSIGSTGASVTALQTFLGSEGYLTVAPTGYFGALTSKAVSGFQADHNIPAVGSVGPITRAQLLIATCAATSNPQASASQAQGSTTPQVIITVTNPATTTAQAATSTPNLPYHATDQFTDWQAAWGDVSTTSTGALHLQGTLTQNGAEAIYPASKDWTNYSYQANVNVTNGNISLIGHYQDANNFLSCGFSKGWVEIDQVQDGTSTVLASKVVDGVLPGISGFAQNTSVTMTLNGGTVSCAGFGPDANVTYTFPLNTAPKSGGTGIESWFETPLADQLDLNEVKVTPL